MTKLLSLLDGSLMDLAPEPDLTFGQDHDLVADVPDLEGVQVIQLVLPTFKDGRAFSQAALLRQRYGFEGEIRASGHVIPDQAYHLIRTGFDSVELTGSERVEDFRRALSSYSHNYQRAVRGAVAFDLRGGAK